MPRHLLSVFALALLAAALAALGCTTGSEWNAEELSGRVSEAMADVSFRLYFTAPFGNGTPGEMVIDHVAPDRWRYVTRYEDDEDCAEEVVMIGDTIYRRPCDREEWDYYPGEGISFFGSFFGPDLGLLEFPLGLLETLQEAQTRSDTEPDGTEVIVLTGQIDAKALAEMLGFEEPEDATEPAPIVEARIRADDFRLLSIGWRAEAGEQIVSYRFEYGDVPPIEVPSPVRPTPTPPLEPLPTPPSIPDTPRPASP